MEIKFNWAWGFLGVLGLLGHVLNESLYYALFVFFIFFIGIKDQKKKDKYEKKEERNIIDLYKISMWSASTALILSGIVLIIWKTIDNTIAIVVLLR